jgi:hypothetical protein
MNYRFKQSITHNNKMSLASNFVGTLSFDVDKVAALPEKCDPYILIKAGGNEVKTKNLKDCRNDATFNQRISLSLDGSEDFVSLTVMDKDRWSSDDVVATSGDVSVSEVLNQWGSGDHVWINLTSENGDKPTKLRVKIEFTARN